MIALEELRAFVQAVEALELPDGWELVAANTRTDDTYCRAALELRHRDRPEDQVYIMWSPHGLIDPHDEAHESLAGALCEALVAKMSEAYGYCIREREQATRWRDAEKWYRAEARRIRQLSKAAP